MKYLVSLAAVLAAAAGSPAMAQPFEKEESRAHAAVQEMQTAASKLQSDTRGASLEQMRSQFNKPAAMLCNEKDGHCPDCPHKDCTECPEHQASNGNCPECAEHGEGLCKEKGHA
ncbi:hypothetical protein [Novosphingobium sp. 9U]|uniref:hypothetical protein n=1 Tax=Novosphingobium sp. 9U TaxID=2653158 RepID=UPI0012EF7BCD|nr:hypothetical protein [Novosphingobium sp. 9U]VWX51107.1 exported hypothetical protein [Novosphingobium sp. 9U]